MSQVNAYVSVPGNYHNNPSPSADNKEPTVGDLFKSVIEGVSGKFGDFGSFLFDSTLSLLDRVVCLLAIPCNKVRSACVSINPFMSNLDKNNIKCGIWHRNNYLLKHSTRAPGACAHLDGNGDRGILYNHRNADAVQTAGNYLFGKVGTVVGAIASPFAVAIIKLHEAQENRLY